MFEWIASPEAWVALVTLTALEIVLGIDNIIFISIVVGRLPPEQRNRARIQGLAMAMIMRILLLLSLAWMMRLTGPLFTIFAKEISGRDLILILGGLFLIGKSTVEIYDKVEAAHPATKVAGAQKGAALASILVQIMILDIVFSLDSVITAVGMVDIVEVMVIAIVIAVGVMMFAARSIGEFVDAHPSIKMLALSFLILVGVVLIGEGWDMHIPKGYIYFAMAFSFGVEVLNIRMRKKRSKPVVLHGPKQPEME